MAKETASNVTSKASEGLSRVSSSAGSTISKIGSGVGNTIQRIGGRTGRLITFVQSMIPPTIYYSKVGLELSKLVFQGRKMTPPSLAEFQTYFSPILNTLRHPSALLSSASSSSASSPETILSRLRNVDRAQMAAGGVILAEVLGFFTAGEMIGKMKVVGYRGDPHAHEAPHGEGH